ncbi:AAA family ATPase [Dyella acidiphila]|uniref:AAA family ATPase n=1 Tax=Dyella acidiphila TaxID=2775866 RepID=A0ABR9GA23_9GAMM|nr:AAA family ATPase [Dyella acidiphila]MBE1160908.1 AAA family ATPase [Dyella acidiphila]
MQLSELGERVCILGPSNSGKSTLAAALGRKLGAPVVHLDQLHHLPNSDWLPRPAPEFLALHDEAIGAERWVIDGNYSSCMPQRLQRATGVILLDVSTATSLFRYLRRTLLESGRVGALEGAGERVKWSMLHYISVTTPLNRRRYREIYRQVSLAKVYLPSRRAVRACYEAWGLQR